MDFIINRIEKIEYWLTDIEKFVEELRELDIDADRLAEKYSLEKKAEEIHKCLETIKIRVKNGQIVEKTDYLKLKQMENQYEDLVEYLSQHKNINKKS